MENNLIATATVSIKAPPSKIWQALTEPKAIKNYMFGTEVHSDFKEGSPIRWKGTWQGKPYEDKGVILQLKPERKMQYSHFSPLGGMADEPKNYHTVTVELMPEGEITTVALSQDNIANEDEREHSKQNWMMMLEGLKKFVEQ